MSLPAVQIFVVPAAMSFPALATRRVIPFHQHGPERTMFLSHVVVRCFSPVGPLCPRGRGPQVFPLVLCWSLSHQQQCSLPRTRITPHACARRRSAQHLCTNLVLGRARRTPLTPLLCSLALHRQRPAEQIHPWYLRLSISHCLLPNTMRAAIVASQASG